MLKKVIFLLSKNQKKQLVFLGIGLLFGVLFEMLGLGLLIPILGLLLKSANQVSNLNPYLSIIGNPTGNQLVYWGMSFLIFVYLIKTLFLVLLSWKQSKFAADLSADISNRLFYGYLKQPYEFHLNRNSAELLRNIQNEVGQFTFIAQSVISLVVEASIVFGVALTLIIIEPIGAMSVLGILTGAVYIFHKLTKSKLLIWGKERQEHSGKTNQHVLQGIGGIKEVKFLNKESFFLSKFQFHNDLNAKILARVATLGLLPRLYLEFLAVFGLVSLIVLMVIQGKQIDVMLPTIGVFAAAAFRIIPSSNRIMSSLQGVRYSNSVIELLYREFKLIQNLADISNKNKLGEFIFERTIEINNLSFKYDQKIILNNISLNIIKGESIGLIGQSGSGKSTLVDLILGLLTPFKGEICIDGKGISNFLEKWQSQIGYVPQSIYLTDDTIKNNIAFGVPEDLIDEKALVESIKSAQLFEFIMNLPDGLNTEVGERGVRLSGGQRQRIGIARALYNSPSVILLDEATSALDNQTENEIMKTIFDLKKEKTIIIVAHRLTTVKECDKVYKISLGKITQENKEDILN